METLQRAAHEKRTLVLGAETAQPKNGQDAGFDCQLLVDISAFRKPENQLSVDLESCTVTTLAEVLDTR